MRYENRIKRGKKTSIPKKASKRSKNLLYRYRFTVDSFLSLYDKQYIYPERNASDKLKNFEKYNKRRG